MGVSCVASVGGVSVEADALLGRGQKNPSALHLPDQHTSPAPTALAADFFDSIGQTLLRVNLQSIHLARLVGGIGLDPLKYATHSMRRTKATTKLWISHH